MSDVFISKGSTRGRIDPATEDLQRDIKTELQKSTASNSLNWGTKRVTIQGNGVGVGPNQPCRTCVISHTVTDTSPVYVGSTDEGTPDALSFLLPTDTYLEIPVRNTNKLSFFGIAGEFVHILWRD